MAPIDVTVVDKAGVVLDLKIPWAVTRPHPHQWPIAIQKLQDASNRVWGLTQTYDVELEGGCEGKRGEEKQTGTPRRHPLGT